MGGWVDASVALLLFIYPPTHPPTLPLQQGLLALAKMRAWRTVLEVTDALIKNEGGGGTSFPPTHQSSSLLHPPDLSTSRTYSPLTSFIHWPPAHPPSAHPKRRRRRRKRPAIRRHHMHLPRPPQAQQEEGTRSVRPTHPPTHTKPTAPLSNRLVLLYPTHPPTYPPTYPIQNGVSFRSFRSSTYPLSCC